ncbi:MAG: phosphotransferase [Planctomycetales bacterium]
MTRSRTVLAELLARYPPGFAPLAIARPPVPGFSGAVIFRVRCSAGDFCVRGWPPGGMPAERILGLHRLLGHVRGAGVTQLAVPVDASDGSTLVRVAGRDWQVEPWLPGRADFHEEPSDARLRAAMRCLADWHRAAASFRCAPGDERWFGSRPAGVSPGVPDRLERIERWHGPKGAALRSAIDQAPSGPFRRLAREVHAAFRRAAPRIADELRSAAEHRVPLQPCLRDVWHDHVLFLEDDVSGLVDPSACRTENVAADIARLLGSLLGDDPPHWNFALAEYERVRPLSDSERRLVPVLDRGGVLLSGMTWLDRVYLRGWKVGDDPRVLDRLATILSRMERLPK